MLNDKHFEKNEYNKIISLGVYTCFEDALSYDYLPQFTQMGHFGAGEPLFRIVIIGIDMNTGEVYELTNGNMKNLLKNDFELYQEYISSPKVSEYHIIQKFNTKHRVDGIYKNEHPMKLEEANVFVKKRNSDTLVNLYLTRVLDGLKRNNAFLKTGIYQERYKNGNIKKLGILTDHHFRQNDDQTIFRVGVWYFCYEDGSLKEEVEYDIFEKKLKSTKYNKNGEVVK